MTSNQLTYHRNLEEMRANRAQELETNRSNLAKEEEARRSNLVKERETERHNKADEGIKIFDTATKAVFTPLKVISGIV